VCVYVHKICEDTSSKIGPFLSDKHASLVCSSWAHAAGKSTVCLLLNVDAEFPPDHTLRESLAMLTYYMVFPHIKEKINPHSLNVSTVF